MLNRFDSIFVVLLLWTVYAETEKVDAPPVSLGLYYESLCPYCRQFIVGQLWPTYSHLSVVMNLTLVPFGNAQVTKDGDKWKFTCQHGPNECYSNIVQTCGLFYITSTKTSLNFIQCISAADEPWQAGEKCAESLQLDWEAISTCANGTHGNNLEYEMAKKTLSLDPPHQYSPWITLNGVHTEEIQDQAQNDLFDLICETYKGEKPSACNVTKRKPYTSNHV
ncbi:gamma-interferon-inducible lysosomal thiol reductase-like isoform X1 [Limulus polyphemus]|uniref:Gamma-interferon-inducible lysosomal thiol reductase-like isoform X1 n=1 Tax=Limulus polyphemus TaxID=6850 RepID=A0ABM1BK64_LIMPO|nr:gamma-interferon-inducible lysosomal thiol reductase-like isoform X1 [Limulus polyphemus]